jgi:hypothetical protein
LASFSSAAEADAVVPSLLTTDAMRASSSSSEESESESDSELLLLPESEELLLLLPDSLPLSLSLLLLLAWRLRFLLLLLSRDLRPVLYASSQYFQSHFQPVLVAPTYSSIHEKYTEG